MWIADYSGESAALTAALFWACSTVSFGRMGRVLYPLEMNLVKNLVAIAMLVITLAPGGQLLAGLPMQASPLFILPIAAAMGERVSPRAVLGVLVALGGVGLIFGLL